MRKWLPPIRVALVFVVLGPLIGSPVVFCEIYFEITHHTPALSEFEWLRDYLPLTYVLGAVPALICGLALFFLPRFLPALAATWYLRALVGAVLGGGTLFLMWLPFSALPELVPGGVLAGAVLSAFVHPRIPSPSN